MKKVLYIAFESPSEYSGGGIGIKQSILSLVDKYQIDYIGPFIIDNEIREKVNVLHQLEYNNNFYFRIINLFRGITTGYFKSWNKYKEKINWEDYEIIFLESSRYNFVAKYVKRKNKKLVVRVHNVEYDYFNNLYKLNKSFRSFIRKYIAKKQEYETLVNSDIIICLSDNDKNRIMEIYGKSVNIKHIEIVPVSVRSKFYEVNNCNFENEHNIIINKSYCLITGSMWYGPNSEGIIWFIKNVWLKFISEDSSNFYLVLAGSRPNDKIKKLAVEENRVYLVDSPKNMEPLFSNAKFYVAPIFNGAGMKVKIAEALSYGLHIIGTPHAFIGYNLEGSSFVDIVNDEEEFLSALKKNIATSNVIRKKEKEEILNLFEKNFSIESSKKSFIKILKTLEDRK